MILSLMKNHENILFDNLYSSDLKMLMGELK